MADYEFDLPAFLRELEWRGSGEAKFESRQSSEDYRKQVDAINSAIGLGLRNTFGKAGQAMDSFSPSDILSRVGSYAKPAIDQLTDAGMGLGQAVSRGAEALTPSQDTLFRIFSGLEAGGAALQGRTPLFMQMQQQQQQAQLRRDQIAQQVAQFEEQKRQNQWEDVFKVLGNDKLSPPQQVAMLKKMGESNPQAARAAMTVNEKLLGRFQANKDFLPRTPNEYIDGLKNETLDWETISAEVDAGEEVAKLVRKENASTAAMQRLEKMAAEKPDDPAIKMALESKRAEHQKKIMDQQVNAATQPAQIAKPFLDVAKTQVDMTNAQAPREVASGVANDKGDVFTDIFNPKTGKVERVLGTPIQRTQDMTPTALEKVIDQRAVLQQIADIEKNYADEFVGPLDNLTAWAKETAPGLFGPISGQEELFRKKTNQLVTVARRIDAGTAQSVQELQQLAKSYPDLKQHESVFLPALEAMRERTTSSLQARSRLAAEIRAGRKQPTPLSERAAQLATLVSAPGFAKNKDDATKIAQDILREEMQLGIVKAD